MIPVGTVAVLECVRVLGHIQATSCVMVDSINFWQLVHICNFITIGNQSPLFVCDAAYSQSDRAEA